MDRKGHFGGYDIWPPSEFPLRRRGYGTYMVSLRGRFSASMEEFPLLDETGNLTQPLDRCCIRIGEALLTNPAGMDLVEVMDGTGLAWTTIIHHLKHMQINSFVA